MFIEEVLAENPVMWGEYHPSNRSKSCVMVRNIGCLCIGTVEQCQEYMRNNAQKYAVPRGTNPEVTR